MFQPARPQLWSASSLLSAHGKLLFIKQPTCKIIIFSVIVLSSFFIFFKDTSNKFKIIRDQPSSPPVDLIFKCDLPVVHVLYGVTYLGYNFGLHT